MTQVLVTGGCGFIGSHLVDVLRERGHEVATYDLVDGQDVLDRPTLTAAVGEAEAVFHCSGVLGSEETFAHIERAIHTNVIGTLNVLEACRQHNAPLVFLSLKGPWHNPYMISKHAATAFCRMYSEYHGLRVSVVRGMNAYGPRQHWGAVRKVGPTFIMQALRGEPLVVFGDGRQLIDLVHARDLAEIMIRVWECGEWGAVLDGGTGVPVTVKALAERIIAMTGSASRIEYQPMRLGEPCDSRGMIGDPAGVMELLDYYPETPLHEGLAQTIAWYRAHGEEAQR